MAAPAPPDVDAVGAVLHARTRVSDGGGGTEAGTFTDDTRPTAEQVERLIEQAAGDVYMRVGGSVDVDLHDSYRHCVALRAAMLVELGYVPEQVGNTTDRTTYQTLRVEYQDAIRVLVNQTNKRLFLRKAPTEPAPDPEPEP